MLQRHLRYTIKVLRHKWHVFIACLRYGLIWQGLIHDLSKFHPAEFFVYAGAEFARDEHGAYDALAVLDRAWLHHVHNNPHHWQHWCIAASDGSGMVYLRMPDKYVLEMLCDWVGAWKTYGGDVHPRAFYESQKHLMKLHPASRLRLEAALSWMADPTHPWHGT